MVNKKGNVLVVILAVLALTGLVATPAYFYLQTKKQNFPPKTESFSCNVDNDCIIGIQTNKCCSCPQAISSKLVGKDNWEIYVKGKNYAPNTEECHRVDCQPCQNVGTPTCQNKTCVLTFTAEFSNETTKGDFCGGFVGKLCATGYTCQLDGNYPDAGGKCIQN